MWGILWDGLQIKLTLHRHFLINLNLAKKLTRFKREFRENYFDIFFDFEAADSFFNALF